jgi:RNA polymerase sigma factor (sigma-70 family)
MSETKSTPASSSEKVDLTEDSDCDLLEMMTWKESDPDVAREAWAELYRRHAKYLFPVCLKYARGLGGDEAAEDLTSETFKHVYERGASTFRPGSASDPDRMRRHVRAWLGRIAHNLACNAYRGRPLQEIWLEQDQWDNVADQERLEDSESSLRLLRLMEQVLTDRERHILRVTAQYYDPRKPNRKLPDEVLEDLGRRWGITHENIRQIKRRALKKLNEAFAVEMDGPATQAQGAR